MIILFDMDDVLEDLLGCWVADINNRYAARLPRPLSPEEITDWDIRSFYPCLSKQEVFAPLFDANMWEKLQPMQNAQEIVQKLKNDGHTIRIVTASHYGTLVPKMKRFFELYPYLTWDDVIVASDKSLIHGDLMVDDGFHNLEVTPCKKKLLFSRPHNLTIDLGSTGIERVFNWDEIYGIISNMTEELNDNRN